MESTIKLYYMDIRKKSRKLYNNLGIPLFLFLILFSVANNYVFVPLLGKLWGLVLTTTPDGFVSNSNILKTLSQSPWIIPIGLVFIVIYALIALWQVNAILIGIGFLHEGKRIRLRDLIRLSFLSLRDRLHVNNWMILVYSLVIVPLANVYQTNDLISRFVIPEYIQDFINANTLLFIIFIVLFLFITYIALRWFFLLPSFILKSNNFKEAKNESKLLTKKDFLKNGIHIAWYSLEELFRLSIIPAVLILIPVLICYLLTRQMDFAQNLYSNIGLELGVEAVKAVTGPLVQISTMSFLVELYAEKLKVCGRKEEVVLPKLMYENAWKIKIKGLQIICSIVFSLLICVGYLSLVMLAKNNSELILDIFGRTEIIAHKGYSSKAPENTMDAFEIAANSDEVSCIELDVRSTKDGIPVVIHNATLGDAAGIEEEVYSYTFEELQSIKTPYAMSKEYPNAKIPSLEEVISTYANKVPLLIEIKGYDRDPEIAAKIVALLKKYDCEYFNSIHSGDYESLKAVKAIDPDIRCGLIMAMVTGNYYDLNCVDFFSIEHSFVNSNTIRMLHSRGKRVYAWTVNYSDSAESLRFSGIDGLITDYPEDINEYIAESNELFDMVVKRNIEKWLGTDYSEESLRAYIEGNY